MQVYFVILDKIRRLIIEFARGGICAQFLQLRADALNRFIEHALVVCERRRYLILPIFGCLKIIFRDVHVEAVVSGFSVHRLLVVLAVFLDWFADIHSPGLSELCIASLQTEKAHKSYQTILIAGYALIEKFTA